MRYQITLPVLATVLASVAVRADDFDYDDIPAQCRSVCNPVAALTNYCDRFDDINDDLNDDDGNDTDDDDDDYTNCLCNYPNANFQVPLCEACIRSVENDDDNDAQDIISTCRFTSTTYTMGATLAAGQSLTLTSGQFPTSTGTGAVRTSAPSATTSTVTSFTTSVTTSGNVPVTVVSPTTFTATVTPTSRTTAAGPATVASPGAAAATALPLIGAGAMAAMAVLCGL